MTTQATHEAILHLIALGWAFYQIQHGQHYFTRRDGTLGPIGATYEAAIAATEAIGKEGGG
jgi:hypothetical protein